MNALILLFRYVLFFCAVYFTSPWQILKAWAWLEKRAKAKRDREAIRQELGP